VRKAHQLSTGKLRREHLVHGGTHSANFARKLQETLDQNHVAERIARLLGERRVVALNPSLGGVGPGKDEPGQHGDRTDQDHEQRAKPPVQEQRDRQEHEQRDKRRKILAQQR
jgi:hypothetical protein